VIKSHTFCGGEESENSKGKQVREIRLKVDIFMMREKYNEGEVLCRM